MSARSVSSRVMISLHVTYSGVVLHLRLRVRMRHPRNYTVRIAKITGMLRWTALILWMSSESTVDGPAIPTYLILLDHVTLLCASAIITIYSNPWMVRSWFCGVRNDVSDVRGSSYKLAAPTTTPSFFSSAILSSTIEQHGILRQHRGRERSPP
jgi:hypothetical protein